MNSVIYLFGASCSGKSTLGGVLQESLGNEWVYIDRDDIIEQNGCTEEAANNILEEKIPGAGGRITAASVISNIIQAGLRE